ncbi:MAG: hypothetical protein AAF442_05365 [Pseudomonadota bacterium]
MDLQAPTKAVLRRDILRAIDASRPVALSETILARALAGLPYEPTPRGLRREVGYLQSKGLVQVRKDEACWVMELTALGVDVLEGTEPMPAGIAPPGDV